MLINNKLLNPLYYNIVRFSKLIDVIIKGLSRAQFTENKIRSHQISVTTNVITTYH
jgi:hypothetical protein